MIVGKEHASAVKCVGLADDGESYNGGAITMHDATTSQTLLSRHLYGNQGGNIIWPNRDSKNNDTPLDISEDMSNANTSTSSQISHPTTPLQQQVSVAGTHTRPSVGLPAPAIVQPFNYSPPVQPAFYDTQHGMKSNIGQENLPMQHAFKAPALPSGLPRKTSNSAIRRNDSYLGSMGRKTDALVQNSTAPSNLVVKRDRVSPNKGGKTVSDSASSMVTLV